MLNLSKMEKDIAGMMLTCGLGILWFMALKGTFGSGLAMLDVGIGALVVWILFTIAVGGFVDLRRQRRKSGVWPS